MRILTHISVLIMTAIAALASLTSCSSDEPTATGNDEITFVARHALTFTPMTRDEESPTQIKDDSGYSMRATALYHTDTYTDFFFQDITYNYNGSRQCWRAPHYCYPLDGTIDLVAFASLDRNRVLKSDGKTSIVTYSTSPSDPLSSSISYLNQMEFDFTQARSPLNPYSNQDVIVSQVFPGIQCGAEDHSDVELNFVHLLSHIRFTFTAESAQAARFIQITGIEIYNAYHTGICRLTRSGNDQDWKIEWPADQLVDNSMVKVLPTSTVDGETVDYISPVTAGGNLPTYDFVFPPQDIIKAHASDNLKYKILFRYGSTVNDYSTELVYIDRRFSMGKKFEPGHRYTYNIICSLLPNVEFRTVTTDEDISNLYLDPWKNENITLFPQ